MPRIRPGGRSPRPLAGRIRSAALALLALLVARPTPANDLSPLSDEFGNPYTLPLWQRVHVVEGWNAEQLETIDISATRPGWLTMIPWTCTWYQDWRGPMAFKRVGGDFVVTSAVENTGRDGVSLPGINFSLGGLMIRTPRNITPATWSPGGENYVFLSVGYGQAGPPRWQFEVKTTVASQSTLILSDAPGPAARLQIARLGRYVICLRREPGGPWRVHQRYDRPDFPDTLQVGPVAYTDWNKAQTFDPFIHNGAALHPPLPPGVIDPSPGTPYYPDLVARWDYVRYFRPTLPAPLVGLNLANPAQVSDAQLLAFLGAVADTVCPQAAAPDAPPAPGLALAAAPNPFSRATALRFTLPQGVAFRLEILDAAGRLVRGMVAGEGRGAEVTVAWDGHDAAGRPAAAGVYFARLEVGGASRVARLIRVP